MIPYSQANGGQASMGDQASMRDRARDLLIARLRSDASSRNAFQATNRRPRAQGGMMASPGAVSGMPPGGMPPGGMSPGGMSPGAVGGMRRPV